MVARRVNGGRFLALIILQLSLFGALANAMELPAELMLDGVNLLKSVEYAQQQHHTHERRQYPLVEGDVAAELPPMLVSADDVSEELDADETANVRDVREQADNRAGNGGGAEVLVPANDYANMAAKLQQQKQRQPPLWLQMHGGESAPLSHQRERQQQPDYEQQPQQQHHHHHYNNNNNNNNKGTFVKLPQQHKHSAHQPVVSTTPAATLPPPPPPQRHCAIEITTKLTGVCQPMAPIGNACIAGDYMDVYNLDCM